MRLWEELEGDSQKIIDFAKAAGMDSPEGFCRQLTNHLFGGSVGKQTAALHKESAKVRRNLHKIASDMNRAAYKKEQEAGLDPVATLSPGTIVAHLMHPGRQFTVFAHDEGHIIVKDEQDHVSFVQDPWNLEVLL